MQNLIIGALIVVVVLGGGYLLLNMDPSTTANQTQNPSPSPATAGAPSVVTDTTASPSNSTVVVSGKVTPNGAGTSYWYEYGTSANLGSKTPNQNVGSGNIAISAPGYITNLEEDTAYHFRLVAENQYGKVAGVQYTFRTTLDTPAPQGSAPTTKTLPASGVASTSANLNGEVTPNEAATQYWFEYGKTSEMGSVMALQSAGDGNAVISASVSRSNLEPATTYYFRLNAQNQFGTVNGAILTFKTK